MNAVRPIAWPVRVEVDPLRPEGYRLYDNEARLVLLRDGKPEAVEADGYTHFDVREKAAQVRDAINAGWAP